MQVSETENPGMRKVLSSTGSMRISLEAIRNGEAGLNQHRKSLLDRVPETGNWTVLPVDRVSIEDLAYISAAVNHEFALLRSKHKDILFHGQTTNCTLDESLLDLLKSKKYKLVAHSHPDYGTIIPSPEDRSFLRLMGQNSSIIISYITGEIREFYPDEFPRKKEGGAGNVGDK